MRAPGMGIQCRFLVGLGLGFLLVFGLLGAQWWQLRVNHAAFVDLGRQSLNEIGIEALRRQGREQTLLASRELVNPLYYFDLYRVGGLLNSIQSQPDVAFARVVSDDGRLIHDGGSDFVSFGERPAGLGPEALDGQSGLTGVWHGDLLVFGHPIVLGDQQLGFFVMGLSNAASQAVNAAAVSVLQDRLDKAAERHATTQFALLAALLSTGLWLVFGVVRGLVWPLRQLAEAARLVEQGRFDSVALQSDRHDELGELMRAFSHMAVSIAGQERTMREMAYSDHLTGLPNRLALRESLEQRMSSAAGERVELALLFLDLDDFKQVNDTLGHDAGDALLVEFAERLADCVPRVAGQNALVARFGGDEFVTLIEGGDIEARAESLANALRQLLAEPFRIAGREVILGSSIGITLYPRDADNVGAMFKHVDIAMYDAKRSGKNAHRFFAAGMGLRLEQRVRLEQDLRGAWQRGEMALVYQPIYRISDRALVGVEALLRWMHPELGPIAPALFVPLAEDAGLIEAVGAQVLVQACREALDWRVADGARLTLAINVSSRQLREGLLIGQVETALSQTGFEPGRLHLELTETAVLADEDQAGQVLSVLREWGIQVWLDDFGTGFSGLSHLRRVPVDGLKIDRSFIADLLVDHEDLSLAITIITLAHARGMGVVAEGIENAEQFDLLRAHGCDLAQGFWLGEPMPANRIERLLVSSGGRAPPPVRPIKPPVE